MTTGEPQPTRNPITLARRLVSGGVALARIHADQAKAEMMANLGQIKGGLIRVVIAVAIVIVVLVELLAFLVSLAVSAGLWWVALIVIVALLAVAGVLAWTGVRSLAAAKFTPDETIASVKEDIEWAKTRLLRRD